MALELDASAASVASADPTGDSAGSASTETDTVQEVSGDTAPTTTDNPAEGQTTPIPAKTEPDAKEGRVVELSRGKRAAESRALTAERERDEFKATVDKYQPFIDMLALAKDDPLEFIGQIADAVELDPDKVTDAIATRRAGGSPTLSVEDKVAALERQIRERDEAAETARQEAEQARQAREVSEARASNVAATLKFLQDNAKDFPAAEADGEEAADAIYSVVESRWTHLNKTGRAPNDQAGMLGLYRDAAAKVNQIISDETERRAKKLGYQRQQAPAGGKPAPQSFRGLSNEHAGHASPPADPNRVHTDDEIRAIAARMFGG